MGALEGRVAILTGSARGLGRQVAERLAREGMKVVLCDMREQVFSTFEEAIAPVPGFAGGYAKIADVTIPGQMEELVDEAASKLGPLGLLMNNAGVLHPDLHVVDLPDDEVSRTFSVNINGVFNGCRAAARVMMAQRAGVIVNMASAYGREGHAGYSAYCASKAAVINLTQSLAREVGPFGVRVNAIAPGFMGSEMRDEYLEREALARGITTADVDAETTSMIPLGRLGTGHDIAGAVVWLAGPDASYVSGQVIDVNGASWVGF
jgi:NAD(P)-dependent dehydrogenase (short-subunit alcohol dehydrogenase family)